MYHIIVNAKDYNETKKKNLETVKSVFDKAGKKYEVHLTEYAGHAKKIAEDITSEEKFSQLVAMGGDGTLHEVLNGIKDLDNCTLGLIPTGTGNDFAAAANIPLDMKFAAESIIFRAPTYIDYIELENGLRSVNAVGCGIDVDVLKRAYSGKRQGKSKYFWAFIKSLFRFKSKPYTVTYDGVTERHTGIMTCLGNGVQIGGGIKMFPEANMTDGYIDLVIVDYLSRFRTLVAFAKLMSGKINKLKEVTHVRCKSASVAYDDGDLTTVQAEGEIYDGVKLSAKIVSGKLKFYLPKHD